MRLTALPLLAALCLTPSIVPLAQQPVSPRTGAIPSGRVQSDGGTNISIETDPRLVAVSAALVLAGYSAGADDSKTVDLRGEIRSALATVDPDLRARLEAFYRAHRRNGTDEDADAVRYRALAILANLPPSFSVAVPSSRIPPDVGEVVGFAALAGELYRTQQFRAVLPKLVEAFDTANGTIANPVRGVIGEAIDYLHTVPIARIDRPAARAADGKLLRPPVLRIRRLKVYGDPLLGGRGVIARGDLLDAAESADIQQPGDRYAVFAGRSISASDEGLRVGVLRYLLDPVVEKYGATVVEYEATIEAIVAKSEAAKSRYGSSHLSLLGDSLIAAVDARLRVRAGMIGESTAVARLGDAQERGQILALHFYDRLKRFEQVGMDIAVVFPEFIQSIAPDSERGRAEQIASARATAETERKAAPAAEDALPQRVLDADRLITAKRFAEARPLLEEILRTAPNSARALFGLAQVIENIEEPAEQGDDGDDALINAQTERLERAVNLYRRAALNASPRELWIASWSHVYAGRILDFLELRDEAIAEYTAAVKVGDVPNGAYREASAGVAAPYEPRATTP